MDIIGRLKQVPGKVGFYMKDLVTGETMGYNEDGLYQAASVIKLPIYAVIMKLAHEGKLSLSERIVCRHEDKVPPCGALYFFTDDESLTPEAFLLEEWDEAEEESVSTWWAALGAQP